MKRYRLEHIGTGQMVEVGHGEWVRLEDVEREMIPRPDAEAVRKALMPLDELIKIGKEGMEPDYMRWLTFHDRVVELASEARTALLRHMGVE